MNAGRFKSSILGGLCCLSEVESILHISKLEARKPSENGLLLCVCIKGTTISITGQASTYEHNIETRSHNNRRGKAIRVIIL